MPEHIGVGMYDEVVRRGTRSLLRKQKGDTRDQVLLRVCFALICHHFWAALTLALGSISLTMARK